MFSVSNRAADNYYSSRNGRRSDLTDFQAIIFCGYGESLYPLTQGGNATPKALLPIGNGVMIDRVLTWVDASGIRDILILCPDREVPLLSEHVRNCWISGVDVHRGQSNSNAQRHGAKHDSSFSVEVHGLSERGEEAEFGLDVEKNAATGAGGRGIDVRKPDLNRKHGDADEGPNADTEGGVELIGLGGTGTPGTARIMRRWRDWIRSDFIVLPCDLTVPSNLALSLLTNRHRIQPGSLVTSLWYEKSELELKDPDGQEAVLVAYDKEGEQLLMVQPLEAMEDDLSLRMSLLAQYPTLTLTTTLQDAHVYVFKKTVLDLMMTRDPKDLDSIREDLVPWLVKGGWQRSLQARWDAVLNPGNDPLSSAFGRSTVSRLRNDDLYKSEAAHDYSLVTSGNITTPSSPKVTAGQQLIDFKQELRADNGTDGDARWSTTRDNKSYGSSCGMLLVKAPLPISQASGKSGDRGKTSAPIGIQEPLIRGNTVSGYWALCREYLRTMPPNLENLQRSKQDQESAVASNIDPRAQVSADSLVPHTTRVGERTSIKKSLIGRHCVIGKNVRLSNVIVWDFVNIADGAKIDSTILCSNVRVGEKAQVQASEIGSGYEVEPDAVIKAERLILGDDA